jgi:hypothetical protein
LFITRDGFLQIAVLPAQAEQLTPEIMNLRRSIAPLRQVIQNDLAGGKIPFANLSAQPARPKFTRSGDIRRLAPLARAPLLNQPFRLGFQGADPFLGAGVGREKDKGLRIFRRCALGLQGFPNPGRFARIITGRRWCNCRG